MPVVSIRMDETLYREVRERAYGADLSISKFLRPGIESLITPGSRHLITPNDEILGVCIQTFALLSTLAHEQSPEISRKGLARARTLLAERGLLDSGKTAS